MINSPTKDLFFLIIFEDEPFRKPNMKLLQNSPVILLNLHTSCLAIKFLIRLHFIRLQLFSTLVTSKE